MAAVAVFLGATTLTYLFCIRPMRRGQCGVATRSAHGRAAEGNAVQDRSAEVERLRQEVAALRAERSARSSGA